MREEISRFNRNYAISYSQIDSIQKKFEAIPGYQKA